MIKDLLTPEDHADPYIWAAVLMAHAFICQILVVIGFMFYDPIRSLEIISLSYLLLWEGQQLIFNLNYKVALDGFLDWLGVSCGITAMTCVYMRELYYAVASLLIVFLLAIIGYHRRSSS